MAGKPPYFPFYVNDFAASAKVEAMTTEQVGAYCLLLCKAWHQEPPGSIPNDDTVLARWARMSPERWREIKCGVLAAFTPGADDRYYQKRMREEYSKLSRLIASRSQAGRAGASSRWQTHPIANAIANGKTMAPDSDSGSESVLQNSSSSAISFGGVGESGPPDTDCPQNPDGWPAWLASEWKIQYAGTAPSQRDHAAMEKFFAELLRNGIAPERARDELRSLKRNRTEPPWEFFKRFGKPAESFREKLKRAEEAREARESNG